VTEGESLPGTVAPSTGTLRAVLLLVHAADAAPDESVAAPESLIDDASAWFRAVSYRRLDFRVETVPRWLSLPARSTEYEADAARYLADAVAAADPYVDFSKVDVVYLAPASRTPSTSTSAILNGFGVRADGREIRLWVPLAAGFAGTGDAPTLLHETGHLLGLLDLYLAGSPNTFHRWGPDGRAMAVRASCLAPLEARLDRPRPGRLRDGADEAPRDAHAHRARRRTKALFVRRGNRVLAAEVRARAGYDRTLCETGVVVYEVDQTPFKRAPIRIHPARPDGKAPARDCSGMWNAPFELGRGEVRVFRLPSWGLRLELLARLRDGSYRVRLTSS